MIEKSTLEIIPFAGILWGFFELYNGHIGNYVFLQTFCLGVFVFAKTILKKNFVIRAKALDEKAWFEWRYHFIVIIGLLMLSAFSIIVVNMFRLW